MDSLERYLDQQPGQANPMTLKQGEVVGDWRIRALIGRGGNAEVYRVEHVRSGSFAALKLLLPATDAAAKERCRKRFQQEIDLLSAGDIPGFPRFCGTGDWQERPYLVEELLEPRDLPRTDRDAAKYLLAICRGVLELHQRGIVHRDLKPSNILFRANGEPVIVDLGLAKCPTLAGVDSEASLENGKPIGVGTPGYAAPEQFMGGEVSPAVDIHALGVLSEKIIAQKEWRQAWGAGVLARAGWKKIIRRATSSIPSERYQTVDTFASAIRHRHWPTYSTVALIALSVLAIVGLSTVGGGSRPPRNPGLTQSALNVEANANPRRVGALADANRRFSPVQHPSAVAPTGQFEHVAIADVDVETLDETVSLNGAAKIYNHPVILASNCTYRITGPGMLDADISGPTNSLLVLKNCVLVNRTREAYPENGVRYQLDNGVYLNFINQKERLGQSRRFLLPYDAAYNEVYFGGPLTLKDLNRLRNEEGNDSLRRENNTSKSTIL